MRRFPAQLSGMDDLDYLLMIVGLFYLHGCAYWVRPGSLVFVSFIGERHRPHTLAEHALLRNDHGGLLFGNLLPLGTSVQTQFWPVSVSPDGVFGWVAQVITPEGRPEQTQRFYQYDDIQKVTVDGRRVYINDVRFITVCSSDLAHHLAALIERLAALPPDRREREIDEALGKAFNAPEANERLQAARQQTLGLMVLCTLLVLYLFAFVPLTVAGGWKIELARYLIAYAGLVGMIMYQFHEAHLALLPADSSGRRKHTLMMLISPANAMHGRNDLFRDVLSRYHPLAVARDCCRPEEFQRFARQILLDLRHPMPPVCPSLDPAACEAERWFRAKLTAAVLCLVRGAGLDPDRVAAPPAPEAAACRSYCPRCSGQFLLAEGVCHGCEIPLRRLDAPPPEPFPLPAPPPAAVAPPVEPAPAPTPPPKATPTVAAEVGRRRKKRRRRQKD